MVSLLANGRTNENKHGVKIHQGENQNDKTKENSNSVLVREMQINVCHYFTTISRGQISKEQ